MKRTKKELAERKAKAAEIAALYTTVANGGKMQDSRLQDSNSTMIKWLESEGPNLSSDLSLFRVIPAPGKPKPKLTGPGGGERWLENAGPRVKGKRTEYRVLETTTTKKKP